MKDPTPKKVPPKKRQVVERERVESAVAIPPAPAKKSEIALGMEDEEMEMCRSHRCAQCLLFVMFAGGWGPAFPEKRDVGRKYFDCLVLIISYGITEIGDGKRMRLARCCSTLCQNMVIFVVIPFCLFVHSKNV